MWIPHVPDAANELRAGGAANMRRNPGDTRAIRALPCITSGRDLRTGTLPHAQWDAPRSSVGEGARSPNSATGPGSQFRPRCSARPRHRAARMPRHQPDRVNPTGGPAICPPLSSRMVVMDGCGSRKSTRNPQARVAAGRSWILGRTVRSMRRRPYLASACSMHPRVSLEARSTPLLLVTHRLLRARAL
jgi:hypothetical protein